MNLVMTNALMLDWRGVAKVDIGCIQHDFLRLPDDGMGR